MTTYYHYHKTAIGPLLLAGDGDSLNLLGFPGGKMARTHEQAGAWPVGSGPWLQSRACAADRWVYSVEGSVASLRLERQVEPFAGGVPLAWQFSLDDRLGRPVRKN